MRAARLTIALCVVAWGCIHGVHMLATRGGPAALLVLLVATAVAALVMPDD